MSGNIDQDVMLAAIKQLTDGKIDFKLLAKELYDIDDPPKSKVEAARGRWKRLYGILKGQAEQKKGGVTGGSPTKRKRADGENGRGKVKKEKKEVVQFEEDVEGTNGCEEDFFE